MWKGIDMTLEKVEKITLKLILIFRTGFRVSANFGWERILITSVD